MEWNLGIAMGEMIGSYILTLGIMLIAIVIGRKSFGLESKWQKKLFNIFGVFAVVVIAITTARGFGSGGAINPAVALMVSVFKDNYDDFLLEVAFELIGGVLAAITVILFAILYNSYKEHKEKIVLGEVFKFNEQHPIKGFGMELVANMFWLLPIMGMVMLQGKADNKSLEAVGQFLVPVVAGFAVVATLACTTEIGVANLNPQVWFGEFLVKWYGNGFKVSIKQFSSELTGVFAVMAIGALWGVVGYALK